MGTAFLNNSSFNWLAYCYSFVCQKAFHVVQLKINTGDFECTVRLKKFTLQKSVPVFLDLPVPRLPSVLTTVTCLNFLLSFILNTCPNHYSCLFCNISSTDFCLIPSLCVSFSLNVLLCTPTMINYLSQQFLLEWTCP